MESLGALLKAYRGARRQEEVAKAARGRHGISQSSISAWESDTRPPTLRALAWLMTHYGATPEQMAEAVARAMPRRGQ